MDQKTLNQFRKILQEELKNFVTKDDLKNFATKDDLKNFITKGDLKAMERRIGEKFATKLDLQAMEKRLTKEIQQVEIDTVKSADNRKTDKEDFEKLEARVTTLEKKVRRLD